MNPEVPMRFFVFRAVLSASFVVSAFSATALWPDLRGKTLYLTGTTVIAGQAFTIDFGALVPGGIPITAASPGTLNIATTGPSDNSALSGSYPQPTPPNVVNGITYPICPNPVVPLTGSFNRTTGAFAMNGVLTGTSNFDFGVADLGATFGVQRTIIQFRNFRIPMTGTATTGSRGEFMIRQPGATSFTFDINSSFLFGTPRLALQNPNVCGFGGLQATITNPAFRIENWTLQQPVVSGTVTLGDFLGVPTGEPATIELRQNGATVETIPGVLLGPTGQYWFNTARRGVHDVWIKASHWLAAEVDGVNIVEAGVANVDVTLINGDIDGSNAIDSDDFDLLIAAFGGPGPIGDLDGTASVDSDDFDILVKNFGLSGAP